MDGPNRKQQQRNRHSGSNYDSAGSTYALTFFVGNEVYDHLEKVVDRFDDVANILHGIVIEHV